MHAKVNLGSNGIGIFIYPKLLLHRSFITELISFKERSKADAITRFVKLPQLWAITMLRGHGRDSLLGTTLLFRLSQIEGMNNMIDEVATVI
jgi:hypothetical protein